MRVDKWLWFVRIYKSRTLASEACKKGQVLVSGLRIKASKDIDINDILTFSKKPVNYIYKVVDFPKSRISPKQTELFREDLTPESELNKLKELKDNSLRVPRPKFGTLSKKDKRDIRKYIDKI